ncbi:GNAT family N-acetyltransferase [Amycolatopsis antarctica]|uniref:GNAT family N-acetyltransferase n=1 Tax=Amycolatopsis antarctica TaxID=1854586 RepID=A0A263D9A1_9PSEU|nr:GNAT family N-acetyltransferase [Amycolatopsis antarctica]OZM75094.1 GNAT family N-acetyltransferase [Amycolatopsis antarctica]
MYVGLVPVPAGQKSVLGNLLQLYLHDSTEFRDLDLSDDGTYHYEWLDAYFTETDREAYFITIDDVLAGFAMARDNTGTGGAWNISEFFVLRSHRRQGVGGIAARALVVRHPGIWTLSFDHANGAAVRFWPAVAESVANGRVERWERMPPEVEYPGTRLRFRVG